MVPKFRKMQSVAGLSLLTVLKEFRQEYQQTNVAEFVSNSHKSACKFGGQDL